jgi:TPR repeat protein
MLAGIRGGGGGAGLCTSRKMVHQSRRTRQRQRTTKVGICYYLGKGVKQYREQATELFNKAAKQGHANAQLLLNINIR